MNLSVDFEFESKHLGTVSVYCEGDYEGPVEHEPGYRESGHVSVHKMEVYRDFDSLGKPCALALSYESKAEIRARCELELFDQAEREGLTHV